MQNDKEMKILAIESSCDETAAAIISIDQNSQPQGFQARLTPGVKEFRPIILSNAVSSQVDLHAKTGGVVPEVASRAHMEAIIPIIDQALSDAHIETISSITHIAVTAGPGLIGSLLVGFNAAKSIAYALDKPIVPINHIEGHIYSALATELKNQKTEESKNRFEFPLLALVVSGGHTSLILAKDHGKYEIIGETVDDAAGEAFDKVSKLLDLGYPGGPIISRLASQYRNENTGTNLIFPRPMINDNTFNFSFSGLKTAVLTEVKKRTDIRDLDKLEIAAAFEDAVVDVLVTKTMRAIEKHEPNTVVLAGGVAANKTLRGSLIKAISNYCSSDAALESRTTEQTSRLQEHRSKNIQLLVPPISLCGDNAAMIGLAAFYHIQNNDLKTWDQIKVDSNWELS